MSEFYRRDPLPARIPLRELESARFGLSVGRLNLPVGGEPEARLLLELVARSGLDLTILRYDSALVGLAAQLLDDAFHVWQADTLLYFSKQLDVAGPAIPPQTDGSLVQMGPGEREELADLVADIFVGYGNHYSANPRLDPRKILAGYVEWAQAHLIAGSSAVLVLRDGSGVPLAVCTTTWEQERAEITLAGVVPEARGRGVYRALLTAVESWLLSEGKTVVDISTQAGTYTPIRAWIARGFQYQLALNTVHLMPR